MTRIRTPLATTGLALAIFVGTSLPAPAAPPESEAATPPRAVSLASTPPVAAVMSAGLLAAGAFLGVRNRRRLAAP